MLYRVLGSLEFHNKYKAVHAEYVKILNLGIRLFLNQLVVFNSI